MALDLAGFDDVMVWARDVYRDLHRHPEPSMAEHRTSALVAQHLVDFGYDVTRLAGTGVVGVLANGPGATVLARADMDALPITEATGLDYASTNEGWMHACGHDVHTTALLAASRLLASHRDRWSGTHIAVFQPGEETGAGALAMVEAGLASVVPRPDVAIGGHVMATPAGTLDTTSGPMLSTSVTATVTVHGRGGHGASPHLVIDPVVIAAAIVMRLQTVAAREVSPDDFAVVTVGALQAGTSPNTIPDTAELKLNLRAYSDSVRDVMVSAVERIVRGECDAGGAVRPPQIEWSTPFPLTCTDAGVTQRVHDAFVAEFGDRARTAGRYTASEDFSRIPDAFGIPYTYWAYGSTEPETYRIAVESDSVDALPGNHSPRFAPVVDPTLATGVRAQLAAALAYLSAGA
ncbi:amidohydrolase [Propionibacteriaceae bacterium G57]|uniref:amidohydrolase n=1 Tax=Aestuariimicrobium sp. G57 TaxID=3418485 RepID=UPI003DA70755